MGRQSLKYRIGTLLGRPRRENFLKILPRHSVGAEIGVFKGGYTGCILETVQPKKLHLIDGWWELFGDFYPESWGPYSDFGTLATRGAHEQALSVVRASGLADRCQFHVQDDLTCLPTFPDSYFDWVYLDSSHLYEHTRRELEIVEAKVAPGGLITGDDWVDDPTHVHHGVAKAVRELCALGTWVLAARDGFGQWALRRRTEDR